MQKATYLSRLVGLLAAALLSVCCLPLTALAAGPVTFNIEYLDENQYIVGTQDAVTAEADKDDLVDMTTLDYKLPAGFEMGLNSDKLFIEDGETVSVHVKQIRVTFHLEYLDEDDHVVATQNGLSAPVDKDLLVDMTALPYELPGGYEVGLNSDKLFIEDGETVSVHLKRIRVNFTLQYRDEENRILGTQKMDAVPVDGEGKVDLAALSYTLPEGCTLAETPGKLAVKNDDIVVIRVKTPPTPRTITVHYWDVENKKAAGVGSLTVDRDVSRVDTARLTDLPAGYELVTRGEVPIVDDLLYVEVKPVAMDDGRVIMNLQFKDGDTVVGGGDFRVPAGVQKYSVLSDFVPQGYVLTQTGDFTAAAGTHLTVSVRKYPAEVVVSLRFLDGEKVVAAGDYFVTEGVQNYRVLERHLPAGYALDKTGDFTVTPGMKLDLPVHRLSTDVIMNIRFMDGSTFVAGGDYTLTEGVRSYTDLERYLPKGYAMDVAGNFMAKAGASLEVPVHKLPETSKPQTGAPVVKPEAKPDAKPAPTVQPTAKPTVTDSGKDNKAARTEVVKANAPAAHTSKIIPQTGLSLKSPVLLGVMLAAALAAVAAYLFVIRKKLD